MDLATSMTQVQDVVETALQEFFLQKHAHAKTIDVGADYIVNMVEHGAFGGKRVRPFLCWLGFYAQEDVKSDPSNAFPKQLQHAMLALELFQSFALIHDDIIDEDEMRRGEKTPQYDAKDTGLSWGLSPERAQHFGESMAILAGDLALSWADVSMSSTGSIEAIARYQLMKEEVMFGQTLDVLSLQAHQEVSKERVDIYKTAYYTVVRPFQIGALLAGAALDRVNAFERVGVLVGRAFQLRDDRLDKAIPEDDFQKEAQNLTQQIHTQLGSTPVSVQTQNILEQFATFVLTRVS